MSDSYMQEQGAALAQHLKLTDGKSGYVEVVVDSFHVHVRRKWAGKQLATWDGLPVEWHESVGWSGTRASVPTRPPTADRGC